MPCRTVNKPEKLLSRRTPIHKLYHFYKPIFMTLVCFGIDLFPERQKPCKIFRMIALKLNQVLAVTNILLAIETVFMMDIMTSTTTAFFCLVICGLIFKYTFFKRRRNIYNLIMLLDRFKLTESTSTLVFASRTKVAICLAMLLSISSIQFAISVPHTIQRFVADEDGSPIGSLFEKANLQVPKYFLLIEAILQYVVPYTFHIYPMNFFILLYSSLAWQLKIILTDFLKKSKQSYSFKVLFLEYSSVVRLVHTADEVLKSLVLKVFVFTSCYFYFALFYLMQSGKLITLRSIVAMVPLLFTYCLLFIMTKIASAIPDINVAIHNAVLHLPHDSVTSTDKMLFLMKSQQDLGLTVGGIVTIKKGLFLSMTGTILTYLLLIKNFP